MSSSYLEKIIEVKKLEVADLRKKFSLSALNDLISVASPVRPFLGSIERRLENGLPAIIAEIKKASPSRGLISEKFNPEFVARCYTGAGATCLSVLTDGRFFQGDMADLVIARQASGLPVLRKDFIVDRYQLLEARASGADCVLLIVAALPKALLLELELEALSLGMSVLSEVHSRLELETALEMKTKLIGINNRDLNSFVTDISTSIHLQKLIPPERIVIAESGILDPTDIVRLTDCGIYTFLIGEAFMRAADPGEELLRFFPQNRRFKR